MQRLLSPRLYSALATTQAMPLKQQRPRALPPKQQPEASFREEAGPRQASVVRAVCTAEAYDLKRMSMANPLPLSFFLSRDVLHYRDDHGADIFFFRHGSFVVWESSAAHQSTLIERVKTAVRPFEVSPLTSSKHEVEEIPYRYAHSLFTLSVRVEKVEESHLSEAEDSVLLSPRDAKDSISVKLAVANALADSVKIATLESLMEEHFEGVRHIPPALERGQRIPINRAQALRLTGKLFHFRGMLNLQSDLLTTPDLYWSDSYLETLYAKVGRHLDNRARVAVLNKKLDYASQLAEVLSAHLSEQHSWRLEWAIIVLITVEAVSGLFKLLV